jgi:hypothetical protein
MLVVNNSLTATGGEQFTNGVPVIKSLTMPSRNLDTAIATTSGINNVITVI